MKFNLQLFNMSGDDWYKKQLAEFQSNKKWTDGVKTNTTTNAESPTEAKADVQKEVAVRSSPKTIAVPTNAIPLNITYSSPAVAQASNTLQSQLDRINSGKTSYSDDVRGIIDKLKNRSPFSYDFNADPLFQQSLASSMASGQMAMQDTIGQASALTGGYGSTYATSAGNQAYNQFVRGAYDNLPQFYNMALSQYQSEGDDLFRQYSMLSEADANEFNRLLDAYNINYTKEQDALAQENWQKTFDYNAEQDALDEEWRNKQWEYNVGRDVISDERYEDETAYDRSQDVLAQENWQKTFDYNAEQDAKANERKDAEWQNYLGQQAVENERYLWEHDINGDGILDSSDVVLDKKYAEDDTKPITLSTAQANALVKAYNQAGGGEPGYEAVNAQLGLFGITDFGGDFGAYINTLLKSADAEEGLPVYLQTWTLIKDKKNRDVFINLNGETMTYNELVKKANKSNLTDTERKTFIEMLDAQRR